MKNTKDSTLLAVLKYSILVLFKLIYYYIVGIAVMRACAEEIRRTRGRDKDAIRDANANAEDARDFGKRG